MKWLKTRRGDTLVEVVFAIAILASVLTTAYHLSTQAFAVGIDSREHTQAINVAQQQAEELRWYADQIITNATPGGLATNVAGACGGSCSMQGAASPTLTGGTYDCSSAVSAGCVAQISTVNDIATDTLLGSHGGTFPEIDEEITVTWPSSVQGTETCLGGGSDCESVSLDERLADTTNYTPIDCSVAGTPGCSTNSGGAVGGGGAGTCPVGFVGSPPNCLPQLSIISPAGSPQYFPLTVLSIAVGNTVSGSPVYLLTPGGTLVASNIASGTDDTFTETYPGGTWSVEACPTDVITTQCSGVLTITPESYTANLPLYEYFNGSFYYYSTSSFADPTYENEGSIAYLAPAGSNRPNLTALYGYYNIADGGYYYSTSSVGPPGWESIGFQGYLGACDGSSGTAAVTPLYQWFSPGLTRFDGYGYYYSTSIVPLDHHWTNEGAIGCVFTSA